ncbi:MAG TPA: PH domain-containing protein, partial [Pedococcus sp.]|nr:PH domain-containing protein [Pedococcus sp.]
MHARTTMIDFQNASYIKLGKIDYSQVASQIDPLLIEGEQGYLAFKGIRDYIVFTSKRIIAV